METRKKKEIENLVLLSTEPVGDGGKKYDLMILIGGLLGLIIGWMSGYSFLGVIYGVIISWSIKNVLCRISCNRMERMTFQCRSKPSYNQLFHSLQRALTPLGMMVEKNKNGNPSVAYQKLDYEIRFNEDNTFSIEWYYSTPLFLIIGKLMYTSVYRKSCVAYGIIGYHVQQICNGVATQPISSKGFKESGSVAPPPVQSPSQIIVRDSGSKTSMGYCKNCGAVYKPDAKFCNQCGTPVSMTVSASLEAPTLPLICPNCGCSTKEGASFCTNCGQALKQLEA